MKVLADDLRGANARTGEQGREHDMLLAIGSNSLMPLHIADRVAE